MRNRRRRYPIRFGGWRGASLVGLAVVAISRALVYLPPLAAGREVPASITALTQGSPLTVAGWGALWLLAALCLLVGAHVTRMVQIGLSAFLFMTSASAAVYLLSWWLLYPPDNGEWGNGIFYAGLAVATFGLIKVDRRQAAAASFLSALTEGDQP